MITQEERDQIRRDYDQFVDETASRIKQEFGLADVEMHPFAVTVWVGSGIYLKIVIVRNKQTRPFANRLEHNLR